jgi:predicted cation transporter
VADERSLGEAHRRLDEHKERLDGMVPREVFNAFKESVTAELTRAYTETAQARAAARTALYGLAASVVALVVGGLILANIAKGG